MIYLSEKIDPLVKDLSIPEKVSKLYQEFFDNYKPENLICYINTNNLPQEDQLVTSEGIRIMASNYVLNNHYYFVPQN